MRKNRLGIEIPDNKTEMSPAISDMQALRLIMAAIIYGEVRHEHHLQHDLNDIEPKVLYSAVFDAVDGLITESVKRRT